MRRGVTKSMRRIRILTVCGSGVISAAMLSEKLTDILEENGYQTETTETTPETAAETAEKGKYDLVVYTAVPEGDFRIPVLNAAGFLVGINEEEFVENLLEAVGSMEL